MDLTIFEKKIPNELITIIFSYIPYYRIVFLNKNFYLKYHYYLNINNKENYIKDIIRNDNSFVFQMIIHENINKWYKIKKYQYKNIICYDYTSFINYFIIKNNANNCKNVLNKFVGIGKNEFKKKNIIINKRWKH
jgi:hypothetical protein